MTTISRLPPTETMELLSAWLRPQETLPPVIRWEKYLKNNLRRQNTLQHSYSIAFMAACVLPDFQKFVGFDEALVLKALIFHDVGEGERQKDTLYIDKNAEEDIAECDAFLGRFGNVVGPEGRKAFLLQFAHNAARMSSYQSELECIARAFRTEILLFHAIERFDYLLYALEQYAKRGAAKIFVQTLRNQIGHFKLLADGLPGFRELLWTAELEEYSKKMLVLYKGRWLEKKGEK